MKKIIALLLTFVMLLSLVPATIAADPTYGYTRGDVDDDTKLTAKDTLLLKKYLSAVTGSRDINELASDVNGDGKVSSHDLLALKNILIGSSDSTGNNTDKKYKVDTVTIAGMNISRYDIVLGDDYTACTEHSAKMLRNYIGKACGIYPNVTPNDTSKHWIKFMFDPDDDYSLGKEGFKVDVTAEGDVYLYCGTLRGPLYVAEFLAEEFLGYRFLLNDVEYLYEAENVDLPAGYTECEVPQIAYRSISQAGVNSNTARLIRDNSCDGSAYGHIEEEYGGSVGTIWIHAHSYAYQMYVTEPYGQPTNAQNQEQPCLTSEETYEKVIAFNDMLIKQRTEEAGKVLGIHFTQVSVSPNDNTNFCSCEACKKIYLIEGSIAGTVFRLSNRVARLYETKYPGLEIYTIAYWDARNPPKYTRPHDSVVVCFCFGGCNNHAYDEIEKCVECGGNQRLQNFDWQGNTFNQSNAADIDYFNKWAELTNNLYIWYYGPNFHYYLAPAPNLFNVYNDFKFVAANGANGIYSEGSGTGVYSFEYLRGYLGSKVAWNPFMSEEEYNELMNEYLMIYYGDGWQYIREYIELVDAASDELGCWTNNYDRPFNMNNEAYFRDNYDYLDSLFEKALAAAANDIHRNRVELCRMQCDFLGLSATYQTKYVEGTEETRAIYAERYARLYNIVESKDVRVAGLDGAHGCLNFPSNGDPMNPMQWLWDDCTGYWVYSGGRYV